MAKKGKPIRFVGSKYGGKKGWINEDKEPGENTIPVIVNLGKKERRQRMSTITVLTTSPLELRRAMRRQSFSSAPIWNAH
jgi:hypothetical protein